MARRLLLRTNGPAVYLAQSQELKVPQGWVFCRIMNWRANGPAVNCRAVGPQIQLTNPVPSPANLRFLGWAGETIGPLVLGNGPSGRVGDLSPGRANRSCLGSYSAPRYSYSKSQRIEMVTGSSFFASWHRVGVRVPSCALSTSTISVIRCEAEPRNKAAALTRFEVALLVLEERHVIACHFSGR